MDIFTFISQLNFLDLLLIATIGFLILIFLFSLYRYMKKGDKLILLYINIAGFIVGFIDQTFMVIFNFQAEFLAIIVLFDYAAYSFWFMLMPNILEYDKKRIFILLWILGSAAANTIFEHISLITVFGSLNYPTEPIVWTSIHTIFFYIGMHAIGTFLVLIGYKKSEK